MKVNPKRNQLIGLIDNTRYMILLSECAHCAFFKLLITLSSHEQPQQNELKSNTNHLRINATKMSRTNTNTAWVHKLICIIKIDSISMFKFVSLHFGALTAHYY